MTSSIQTTYPAIELSTSWPPSGGVESLEGFVESIDDSYLVGVPKSEKAKEDIYISGRTLLLGYCSNIAHFFQDDWFPIYRYVCQADLNIDTILVPTYQNETVKEFGRVLLEILAKELGATIMLVGEDTLIRMEVCMKKYVGTNLDWERIGTDEQDVKYRFERSTRWFEYPNVKITKSSLDRVRATLMNKLGITKDKERKLVVIHNDTTGKGDYYAFRNDPDFQRVMLNEAQVEEVFKKRGYEVAVVNSIADYSFKELTQLYVDASIIIGALGAHTGQCLFTTRDATSIVVYHPRGEECNSGITWFNCMSTPLKILCGVDSYSLRDMETEYEYEKIRLEYSNNPDDAGGGAWIRDEPESIFINLNYNVPIPQLMDILSTLGV